MFCKSKELSNTKNIVKYHKTCYGLVSLNESGVHTFMCDRAMKPEMYRSFREPRADHDRNDAGQTFTLRGSGSEKTRERRYLRTRRRLREQKDPENLTPTLPSQLDL